MRQKHANTRSDCGRQTPIDPHSKPHTHRNVLNPRTRSTGAIANFTNMSDVTHPLIISTEDSTVMPKRDPMAIAISLLRARQQTEEEDAPMPPFDCFSILGLAHASVPQRAQFNRCSSTGRGAPTRRLAALAILPHGIRRTLSTKCKYSTTPLECASWP